MNARETYKGVARMAWLLTIFGRPFLRVGGTGDLRAFQTAFRASLMLAACAALLILTTPFLADYAVMNVALFLILFTLDFLTARIPGSSGEGQPPGLRIFGGLRRTSAQLRNQLDTGLPRRYVG